MSVQNKEKPQLYIGIDWADAQHAFHAIDSHGELLEGQFDQNPQDIEDWFAELRRRFPNHQLSVILEQSKGALITALMKYPDLQLYPINPGKLAKYRESQHYSGCKDDPTDAQLLAQYLMNYSDKLRVLRSESAVTRELLMLTEDRRRLVDRRTALAQELTAVLKQYFPLLIDFQAAKPYARFLCQLILRWPTLAELQRARPETVRRMFHKLNIRRNVEPRIAMIRQAVPLTNDEVLIKCYSLRALCLAEALLSLSDAIDEYDTFIEAALAAHEDRDIFASLPGAAKLTQSRMIAALGTQRDRFVDTQSFQSSSGIAPVMAPIR